MTNTVVEKSNVIVPVDATDEISPAQFAATASEDMAPAAVCELFLKALRSENPTTAGQFLTKKALHETRRADLVLDAPGGSSAQFKLGETLFATNKREVAHVEFFVHDGQDSTKLFWNLKKEKVGWKISGMLLTENDVISEFVDFENRQTVERIKAAMHESDDHEHEITRQASHTSFEEDLK
ncbi:MAG TPA: hypothetical protein PKD64_02745 [Pirellulaceae bacterium]|nr:hypothetical protein [Pirellulaceae bacterium]HMO91088.1 hypothetical protein [Pirellulaceae bacterium]HMP71187.1 hypothetical protein [Pirellulaceae bacterium]